MEPTIWGKHAWVFLHSISMNYPDKPSISDKKNYKDFFENLKFILPCEVCKKHYSQHIHKNPIRVLIPNSSEIYGIIKEFYKKNKNNSKQNSSIIYIGCKIKIHCNVPQWDLKVLSNL